jgi:hypothetical protein
MDIVTRTPLPSPQPPSLYNLSNKTPKKKYLINGEVVSRSVFTLDAAVMRVENTNGNDLPEEDGTV